MEGEEREVKERGRRDGLPSTAVVYATFRFFGSITSGAIKPLVPTTVLGLLTKVNIDVPSLTQKKNE